MKLYRLVSSVSENEKTLVRVKDGLWWAQGCSYRRTLCVEAGSSCLLLPAVCRAGATVLRGGAFKTRTSPYSFQGLGEEGLRLLKEASEETGLATVTEVLDKDSLELALEYVDMLQIGAWNMQNSSLLRMVGVPKPVLLKRGFRHSGGVADGRRVLLLPVIAWCSVSGGIRTFESATRNTWIWASFPCAGIATCR